MTEPQKVQSGDEWRPSAGAHNAFVDAWRYYTQIASSGGAGVGKSVWGTNIIQVRNKSEADRDRFDVLGISEPVIDPTDNLKRFKNSIVFDGVKPTDAHFGQFVVLLQPLKTDQIGMACVAGVTVAKVNFTPSGDHQFCEAADGDAGALETLAGGSARILWPSTGTGVEWSVVRLGDGEDVFRFQLAADHPGRGIPFNVWLEQWDPASNGPIYDKSRTFKAVDWYYGVPYPSKCSCGHGRWKRSDTYGRIIDVIGMDCETPGCAGSSGSGSGYGGSS